MNVLSFADGRILSMLAEIPMKQVCRGGAISGGAAQQQIAAVRRPLQRVDSGEPVIQRKLAQPPSLSLATVIAPDALYIKRLVGCDLELTA